LRCNYSLLRFRSGRYRRLVKPRLKWTLIAGMVFTLGAPFIGLMFTVIAMVMAFHTLGENGISDPKTLSASIGMALISTEIGIVLGILGLPLIVVALILHFTKNRGGS